VEYLHSGMLHQVRVDREVGVGAFDSPKLLMLSGIGDAHTCKHWGFLSSSICRVSVKTQDHVVVSVVYQATQNLHLQAPVVSGKLDYFCIAWNLEATPDYSSSSVPFSSYRLAIL